MMTTTSDLQTQLLEAISKGDTDKCKILLSLSNGSVNWCDSNGMTPLAQACFKGNIEVIEELLLLGANVNPTDHSMGYTPLMFAALSGKIDCVKRLLHAGAKTYVTNTVGRTASQMAAFVGNHAVVSVINNYVAKSEIEHYTRPDGPKQIIRLPTNLVEPLHSLLIGNNMSPVYVVFHLLKHVDLLENHEKVVRVLNDLCSKHFQHATEPNEILALKSHIIACIIKKAGESKNEGDENLQKFVRLLLKPIGPEDVNEGEERLLRQSLREFPYAQSTLLQQIVRPLSTANIGSHPTAYEVLDNVWNGQKMFGKTEEELEEDKKRPPEGPCSACKTLGANKVCSKCRSVFYCNEICQRAHWFAHKKRCPKLKENREKVVVNTKAAQAEVMETLQQMHIEPQPQGE